MPTIGAVESWAEQVPDSFRFVLKTPQTITHHKRLKEAEEATDYLLRTASALKDRQGPLLFQLPPNFKKDVPRLAAFLDFLDNRAPSTFEFRHESWLDDEVFGCLRGSCLRLCVADADELPLATRLSTADWGYLRLRREAYSDEQLADWIAKIRSENWSEAYVFFKHEESGTGPKLAARFLELAGD